MHQEDRRDPGKERKGNHGDLILKRISHKMGRNVIFMFRPLSYVG